MLRSGTVRFFHHSNRDVSVRRLGSYSFDDQPCGQPQWQDFVTGLWLLIGLPCDKATAMRVLKALFRVSSLYIVLISLRFSEQICKKLQKHKHLTPRPS